MSFKFKSPDTCFSCKLACQRCTAETQDGKQCRRRTCRQLPYCFQHTASTYHVHIAPSTIAAAGLGLFALKAFRPNEIIVPYQGEILTKAQLDARYDALGPYALKVSRNKYIDSACERGTGSFINTNPGHNNARFSFSRQGKAFVRATCEIPKDKEIFVDYGDESKTHIEHPRGVSHSTR